MNYERKNDSFHSVVGSPLVENVERFLFVLSSEYNFSTDIGITAFV